MIGKVKTGANFKGVLMYNSKGEIIDKNILADDLKGQVKEFKDVADLNTRAEKKVKHFVLSFAEADRPQLDDYKMSEIAREFLKKMGYEENQYITYKHTDSAHLHLHIVASRIRLDNGKTVKDGQEMYKSRDVIRFLEKKYGLVQTPKRSKATKRNTKTIAEMRKAGKPVSKDIIKAEINFALSRNPKNEKEFIAALDGIGLRKTKSGHGYVFQLDGQEFSASNVDRKFSFANLQKTFDENRVKAEEARKPRLKLRLKPKPKLKPKPQIKQQPTPPPPPPEPKPQKTLNLRKGLKEAIDTNNATAFVDLTMGEDLKPDEIKYLVNSKLTHGEKTNFLISGGVKNPEKLLGESDMEKESKKLHKKLNDFSRRNQNRNKDLNFGR